MNILKSSLVQLVLGLLVIVAVWAVGTKVNSNLTALPVKQVPEVQAVIKTAALPGIFPVWAGRKAEPLAPIDTDVEGAFNAPEPVATGEGEDGQAAGEEVEVVVPNYAEQLRPNVKVEGVAEGGAFINGKYYRIGRSLDALAVQDIAGGTLLPRLRAASTREVVIAVGGDAITFKQGAAGWE